MKDQFKELLALHFLNDGVRTTLIVLLPFIAKDLSLSLTQVGFLGSSQALIASILALPTGFIAGKIGGFKILTTLLLIYSIGALGISISMSAFALFCMFYLAALGFGTFHTIGFSLTAKTSIPENIGKNMGNFTSIGEIGRVTLPPLAVFATSVIGWRETIGIIAIIGLVLYVISRFTFTKDISPEKHISKQHHVDYLKDIISLFKNKHAISITAAAIIDSFASSPIYVFLPFLLVSKGINTQLLGITMGGFFIGSLFGKSLLGRSVDKLGNVKVFVISEFCMAFALLCISESTQYALLLFFAMLLGIFTKGTSPVVQTMFSELSHKDHYYKIYAVSELTIGFAAVITIIVMGTVADKTNIHMVFYLCALLACLATIPILTFSKAKGSHAYNPVEIEGRE